MADTSNLNQFLTDVANSIRTKKGTEEPIPAENFDTEIDSIVTGTVVEKVVAEASKVVEDETVVKIDSAPIEEPIVIPENGVAEVLTDKALLAENIGLTADKIAKGNVILNIEGTAEGGGGGDTSDATSDGNLQAKYLLEGYSAVVDGKLIEGTMKEYGTKTIIPTSNDIEIPEGHYNLLLIPIINAANCENYSDCNVAILSI